MKTVLVVLTFLISFCNASSSANILMSEVFEIIIDPTMFNWTFEGHNDQYIYQPSLINKPDLPSWMNYVYSDRYHSGFLYGVPPYEMTKDVQVEIVALNRKNYETRRNILSIVIGEKLNPAKNEVQMKIDNLNVEDMFDADRMDRLKDVFRKRLWLDSQEDLYVTYLASAVDWGARLPLDPTEGEGIIIRIGSTAALSQQLIELQEEVKPLWKVPTCPRGFKRTTVERYFRDAGFALDWCSFRLVEESPSGRREEGNVEKLSKYGDVASQWVPIGKNDVPERSYAYEFVFATFVPLVFMALMAAILSLALCFHHKDFEDEQSEIYFDNIFHLCTDCLSTSPLNEHEDQINNQYTTINPLAGSLKSLNNIKDYMYFSPESMGTSRSHTNSPTLKSRGVHCRPSPPPYIKPTFKPNL